MNARNFAIAGFVSALGFGLGPALSAGDGCCGGCGGSKTNAVHDHPSTHVAAEASCSDAKKDIVDTAASAGSFKTLLAAAKAAGLVDTLKSRGPFTVFAPTDEAFAKLPEGAVQSLLEDTPKLKSILLYHVVPGRVMAADVMKVKHAKTALGQKVKVRTNDGVMINNSKVVKADIATSNGVIHVIDRVLMPESDLVDTARGAGSFNTLLAAIEAVGLIETLRTGGPYTVFAPTDAAFAKLPDGTVESLLGNKEKLRSILLYHVVAGEVTAKQVVKLSEAKTVMGQTVAIKVADGVRVNDANVVKTDIMTGNGVIHVIDSVLIPQG